MQTTIINIAPEQGIITESNAILNFRPFVDHIKTMRDKTNDHKKYFLSYIIEQFEKHPALLTSVDPDQMKSFEPLMELVYNSFSRMVEDEEEKLWALNLPMQPTIFYCTNAMFDLISGQENKSGLHRTPCIGTIVLEGDPVEYFYSIILEKCYGLGSFFSREIVHCRENSKTGLTQYFKEELDLRFINIQVNNSLPEFKIEQLQAGIDKAEKLRLVKEMLPLSMFTFEGFGITVMTEVSVKYAVENIKSFILNKEHHTSENYFSNVIHWLKIIVESNEVEFGLLPVLHVNNKLVFNEGLYVNSIMANAARKSGMEKDKYLRLIDKFFNNPQILFFNNVSPELEEKNAYLKMLSADDIFSYALIPVYLGEALVGVLEVYSRKNITINEALIAKLDPVMQLLSQLLQNGINEFYDNIDKVIKEQFTSIQPSVQWKFNEAAWHYLRDMQGEAKVVEIDDISFEEVYPLYGAIDIRNSTLERNEALNKDLQVQYTTLIEMLEKLKLQTAFGLIDEKIFMCKKWLAQMTQPGFNDLIQVTDFTENNIIPFLDDFKSGNKEYATLINEYFNCIEETGGEGFGNRSKLEKSMSIVVNSVNTLLGKMQREVQQSYPSYFEKFRTDGVEYDIYIGQSIAPEKPFSDIYLKNLRLLQLNSMAAITKFTANLSERLPVNIQTTQLIFIHSQPINIKFRKDEKRFDVEGAYNIRYHVVKKRIDKVNIKDTEERLTQPNKIALVYINQQDAEEYMGYISYLQEQGILSDDLEQLDLEELQGVNGLKALRVGVQLKEGELSNTAENSKSHPPTELSLKQSSQTQIE